MRMTCIFWNAESRRPTWAGFFGLTFAVLTLLNWNVLTNPPVWDEILGLHNQALYLAKNHFDIGSLFVPRQGYLDGGSGVYRFGVIPWVYGVFYWLLPPLACHVVGHLLTIACWSGCATLLWSLLTRICSMESATLWTLVALSEPVVAGRTAAMDQDSVLAFAVMVSLFCLSNRRRAWALFWALAACAVKFTGVILCLAYVVYFFWESVRFFDQPGERRRFLALGVGAVAAAGTAFGLNFLGTTAIDGVFDSKLYSFSTDQILYHWRYYFPLLQTAALGVGLFFLYRYAADRENRTERGPLLAAVIFIFGFFTAYSLSPLPGTARLPRYACIVVFPLILTAGTLIAPVRERWLQVVLIGLFCVNGLNWHGLLLPSLREPIQQIPAARERSREYLDVIDRDRELCAMLEKNCFSRRIVLKWPYVQMLGVPEFRYVGKALPNLRGIGALPSYVPTALDFTTEEVDSETLFCYSPRGFEFLLDAVPLYPPAGAVAEWVEIPEQPASGVILFSGVVARKDEKKNGRSR